MALTSPTGKLPMPAKYSLGRHEPSPLVCERAKATLNRYAETAILPPRKRT